MAIKLKEKNIWNRVFVSAFVINMLLQLTTQMMNSTFSSKYADSLGASPSMIGTISSMFALTALIFKIFSAPAIDTFHRRYVLMGASAILLAAYVCYFFSSGIVMLMMGRLVQGAGQAFTTTCCLTIASDSLPPERMSAGIGYFSMAQAIAQAIAPVAALKMAVTIGYQPSFAVLAVITILVILISSQIKLEHTPGKKFKIALSSIIAREALLPASILFLLSTSYCVVNAFLVLYAQKERGIKGNIGFFFTVYAITLLFSRPLIGSIADRYGTVKVLIPSVFCFMASFWMISMADSLPVFFAAAFISAFGFGGCQPAVQAVAMRSVPTEKRGAASCTSYVGNDVGNLVGGTLAGYAVQTYGYVSMWKLMTIPLILAVVVIFLFRSTIQRIEQRV